MCRFHNMCLYIFFQTINVGMSLRNDKIVPICLLCILQYMYAGLPVGMFSYQKSQFGFILKGLEM
jgi:hypothetical protein